MDKHYYVTVTGKFGSYATYGPFTMMEGYRVYWSKCQWHPFASVDLSDNFEVIASNDPDF